MGDDCLYLQWSRRATKSLRENLDYAGSAGIIEKNDRDEIGRALLRKGVSQQVLIGSLSCPVVIMFTLLGRSVEDIGALDNFFVFLLTLALGGLAGLLLGVLRGLPVAPVGKLSGWPSVCCTVSYYHRVKCPCLFSCVYCSEVHSRHMLLVVSLEETELYDFKRMLSGNLRSNKL